MDQEPVLYEYVASGRDVRGEVWVKVSASSDQEAYHQARQRMPVLHSLERFQPDGSLLKIEGFPCDPLNTPVTPISEVRHEEGRKAAVEQTVKKWAIGIAILLVVLQGISFCTRQFVSMPATAPATRANH
jgi:hypothetical protein